MQGMRGDIWSLVSKEAALTLLCHPSACQSFRPRLEGRREKREKLVRRLVFAPYRQGAVPHKSIRP